MTSTCPYLEVYLHLKSLWHQLFTLSINMPWKLTIYSAHSSPTDNQGVIVISSMCLGEACFLFSQICRGFAPSSPWSPPLLNQVSIGYVWLNLHKKATDGLTGDYFYFFKITADLSASVFPTALDECEEGRPSDSRDLRRQTLRGYHNKFFFSPGRRGKIKGMRGKWQAGLPPANLDTRRTLCLSAGVIRLYRTPSSA